MSEELRAARSLEEVLADWLEDAKVLRKWGHGHDADVLERMVSDVRAAAEPWLTWLSEADALLRSGRPESWLRHNRARWLELGHARKERGTWYYRLCIIPQRKHLSDIEEDTRRAAQEAREQEASASIAAQPSPAGPSRRPAAPRG